MKKYYCKDCEEEVLDYRIKRCYKCYLKWIKNPKNCPNYIDNRSNKIYYCLDCVTEISDYRHKRCYFCANKRKKHTKETKEKISLTKGGTGIPYEFNKYPEEFFKIKYWILKRDNHRCQKCNKYTNEVHHIDYNKNNNEENNLITLCHKCNMKANTNRDYWFAYYTYIIEKKLQ